MCLLYPFLQHAFYSTHKRPWASKGSDPRQAHCFLLLFSHECYSFLLSEKSQIQLYIFGKKQKNSEVKMGKVEQTNTEGLLMHWPFFLQALLEHICIPPDAGRCEALGYPGYLSRANSVAASFLVVLFFSHTSFMRMFSCSSFRPLYSLCCLSAPDNLGEGWRER